MRESATLLRKCLGEAVGTFVLVFTVYILSPILGVPAGVAAYHCAIRPGRVRRIEERLSKVLAEA